MRWCVRYWKKTSLSRNLRAVMICGVMLLQGCAGAHRPVPVVPVPAAGTSPLRQEIQPIEQPKLAVGEQLRYRVIWLGLHVADATLTVTNKMEIQHQPVYRVKMAVVTKNFFRLIYNVRGYLESYISQEDFRPLYHESEFFINRREVVKKITFDHDRLTAFTQTHKDTYEKEFPPEVVDPLGVLYYFRLHQTPFGEEPIELTVSGGKKNYRLVLQVGTPKDIRTKAGTFLSFPVRPTEQSERQFDDALDAPGSFLVWFSADERRLPVLLTLKVPLGTAQAWLQSIGRVSEDDIDSVDIPVLK